jgi:colanic acid biosynthesis glycosyl transferase WcaI
LKVLLLNQCFWPDVVATSQQLTGAARALRDAGHEVTVIAARRGYDDPQLTFRGHENWHGIEIHRVRSIQLGKKSRWRRVMNFASFLVSCAGRLLLTPRHDVVVALTSPPLISWLASVFTQLKGGRLVFWVMDLNPDEAIAAGWLERDSLTSRVLSRLLLVSLRQAHTIVALDRFMKARIVAKEIAPEKIEVVPPEPDPSMRFDGEGREAFRRRHCLNGKFVVMYAGNHSPCNPLDTLLDAAKLLKDRDDLLFLFVGGGSELDKVKETAVKLNNIRWLPYQAPADLKALLSAADLHVVVMGDAFKGIIHPSKIYNILAVGAPFLFIGPTESHVADLISILGTNGLGRHLHHGDVAEVAQSITARAAEASMRVRTTRTLSESSAPSRIVAIVEAAAAGVRPPRNLKAAARASAAHS